MVDNKKRALVKRPNKRAELEKGLLIGLGMGIGLVLAVAVLQGTLALVMFILV